MTGLVAFLSVLQPCNVLHKATCDRMPLARDSFRGDSGIEKDFTTLSQLDKDEKPLRGLVEQALAQQSVGSEHCANLTNLLNLLNGFSSLSSWDIVVKYLFYSTITSEGVPCRRHTIAAAKI